MVVDMDMFYFACHLSLFKDKGLPPLVSYMNEMRPLSSIPACVGGGMITTSNYVARRYGVRSAMAGFIGDALVRELSGGREEVRDWEEV